MTSKLFTAARAALIISILATFSGAGGKNEYERYADSRFSYRLYVPAGWTRTARDLDYKHVLTLRRGDRADIAVTATTLDGEEKGKWEQWKTWAARGNGGRLRPIIETGEFTAGGTTFKIMVFEYTFRGRRVLQRTMLAKNGERLLAVECRSPIRFFSGYTEVFNKVMASVVFSTGDGGEGEKAIEFDADNKKKDAGKIDTDKKDQKEIKKEDASEKEQAEAIKKEAEDTGSDSTLSGGMKKETTDRTVIEEELKKIEELERKGIIEKVDDSEI